MELNKQTVVEHPETGEAITLFEKVDKRGEERTIEEVVGQ